MLERLQQYIINTRTVKTYRASENDGTLQQYIINTRFNVKQLSFPTMEFRREGKKSFVVTPTFHVTSNIFGTKKHANTVAISCDC